MSTAVVCEFPLAIPVGPGDDARDALRWRVRDRLTERLDLAEIQKLPEQNRRGELRPLVARFLAAEEPALAPEAREALITEILDELLGLGPLERLLREPGVSDILVNGPRDVWVERGGKLEPSAVRFRDDDHLLQIIDRVVSRVGRRIHETSPMVDARLADGSRVNAIIPPLSLRGPALSVRRFPAHPLTVERLV